MGHTDPRKAEWWTKVTKLLLVLTVAPFMAYASAALTKASIDLMAWHGFYHWAPSLGDIGQGIALVLSGAVAGLFGWFLGFSIPVRDSALLRTHLTISAGAPTFILIVSWVALILFGGDAAALICTGAAYGLCLLLGSLAALAFEAIRNRASQSDGIRHRCRTLLIMASPLLVGGVGIMTLHIVHATQAAARERACLECMQVILQAESRFYQSHKTLANLDQLALDPVVNHAMQESGGYRLAMSGPRAIMATPENAAKWQGSFYLTLDGSEIVVKKSMWAIGSDRFQEKGIVLRQKSE